MSSKKFFNDPVYGFIEVRHRLLFELLNHPYFQRLRNIRQLGMTHLVYPGALHTRFQHAMGAMYLAEMAVDVIRSKGHKISEEEAVGVSAAVLLHDIGHGPFSHALEHSLVNTPHEDLSILFISELNEEFGGKLGLASQIFTGQYEKKFLHQMVSSQLDMDRMDYLNRDSFFCGVSEGTISSERIIKMLEVSDDSLVVEGKGIYSVENFIIARRLMYWQVYLHKTVIAAENLLIHILKRARSLMQHGADLPSTPALKYFLKKEFTLNEFKSDKDLLKKFSELDDSDVFTSIKMWMNHSDKILSVLSSNLVNRNLFKTQIQDEPFEPAGIAELKNKTKDHFKLASGDLDYFVFTGELVNKAYNPKAEKINIIYKDGRIEDIASASDNLNITVLSEPVKKYFLCYPREIAGK